MKKTVFAAFIFVFALVFAGCVALNPGDDTGRSTASVTAGKSEDSRPAVQDTESVTAVEVQTEPAHAPYELFKFKLLDDGTYEIKAGQNVVLPDNLVLPASYKGKPVTVLGESSFAGYRDIVSVAIPEGYTVISNNAFSSCTDLSSVTIPDGVTSIGNYVFLGCTGLTSITIPDSVTSIGEGAFAGCTELTSITIPDGVTSIGSDTFYGGNGLTSITIPDSVTSIGEYAFYACYSLTSINFNGTVEQWDAIYKDHGWSNYTGDYTVHCTDGDIPIN